MKCVIVTYVKMTGVRMRNISLTLLEITELVIFTFVSGKTCNKSCDDDAGAFGPTKLFVMKILSITTYEAVTIPTGSR
jgi:hypothetical protein